MKNDVPRISVLMPCYNEEKFITKAIESLLDDYFFKNCELIVIDGMSNDRTQEIIHSFKNQELRIKLIKNKKKLQAYGLNLGISEAKGEIILRADAHSLYPSGYIKKCVDLLETTRASNVGGIMLPQETNPNQKGIALALRHPMGVGDAKWHLGNFNGFVDTVYLGTFWKKMFYEIGPYDTNCSPNEDAELNLRIQKTGKKIYLDSSIKVVYFPRETLKDLTKQYFRYGRGRCCTTIKHRKITSLRQLAPVALIICLFISIVLSIWETLFLIFPFSYFLTLCLTALLSWPKKSVPLKQRILTGIAWASMHLSWGAGFLSYLIFHRKIKSKF